MARPIPVEGRWLVIYLMRPSVGEKEFQAIGEVFTSKFLTEGDFTRKFEKRIANYIGVNHVLAVTSCTTALELALESLEVGAGDEVIVPDFTHPATALAILSVGAKPVLVDVNPADYNIDVAKLEHYITSRTKCVLPVSLFGNPANLKTIRELKDRYGLYIVEDAACSLGAEVDGAKVGSQADITCFSFHPRKIITTGEGGALATNLRNIYERVVALSHFGSRLVGAKLEFSIPGTNYKLSNILAAIGIVQIQKIEDIITDRLTKATLYLKLLDDIEELVLPTSRRNCRHTYQTFCLRVKGKRGRRDSLKEWLKNQGIETQIGTYALHLQPCFASYAHNNLTVSEELYHDTLALPLHQELTLTQQHYICEKLKEGLRHC